MADSKVATRFAKSLYGLSVEKGNSDRIFADAQQVRSVLRENKQLASMLRNPIIHNHKKLSVIRAVFSGKVDPMMLSFMELVVSKNRESFLSEIAAAYFNMYNESKGIRSAKVITAVKLDDQLRKQLVDIVAGDTGGKIELTEEVDPSIVGGFILRWGDRQIDASVSKKLRQLKMEFARNSSVK
jgi:F-type H+-transporting ATPase subunit delta